MKVKEKLISSILVENSNYLRERERSTYGISKQAPIRDLELFSESRVKPITDFAILVYVGSCQQPVGWFDQLDPQWNITCRVCASRGTCIEHRVGRIAVHTIACLPPLAIGTIINVVS